jgi:glycosyltransferase involved in cell wall biosynthesis
VKIVLIGNYAPDRQESMRRFASVLFSQYQTRGLDVEMLQPEPVVAGGLNTLHGLGKWLGYIDKFVLFPRRLAARASRLRGTLFVTHVCDHSNASYARQFARRPHLVTCHDLLAVRSALGEFPRNPTRWSGRQLQRIILAGLNRARRLACDSEATRQDALRLTELPADRVGLVYMGLNYPYHPMPAGETRATLQKLFPPADPVLFRGEGFAPSFLLHVGGGQWYKNRAGLLQIYAALRRLQPAVPPLVLVGAPLSSEITRFIERRGFPDAVRTVQGVGNEDLRALYSTAECLVFPSLAEGFGWPIAEAQACGCRVVTTGRAPMTEVGGEPALYVNPEDIESAAARIAGLLAESSERRSERMRSGLAHARRFCTQGMIDKYLAIYQELAEESR